MYDYVDKFQLWMKWVYSDFLSNLRERIPANNSEYDYNIWRMFQSCNPNLYEQNNNNNK